MPIKDLLPFLLWAIFIIRKFLLRLSYWNVSLQLLLITPTDREKSLFPAPLQQPFTYLTSRFYPDQPQFSPSPPLDFQPRCWSPLDSFQLVLTHLSTMLKTRQWHSCWAPPEHDCSFVTAGGLVSHLPCDPLHVKQDKPERDNRI